MTQSKAVQGNRQDVDYPKIKSDILPGITENGIVLFEPLNATQNHAKIIFETSVGYSKKYRFTFDVNLSANVNKEPELSSYQNFDYKIRLDCPTNWIKTTSSNTSNFSLFCRPPEANLTTIGLKAKAAYIPSSERKQYLSSVLSSLRNDTKLRIINSSFTTISNNSALQVFLMSSNGNQVKRLDTVTNTDTTGITTSLIIVNGIPASLPRYHYTIYYEANSEHFNKYLPIAQKVMNSFQIIGSKLPEKNQSPRLGQIPELPSPGFPQLPELPPLLP